MAAKRGEEQAPGTNAWQRHGKFHELWSSESDGSYAHVVEDREAVLWDGGEEAQTIC